MKNSVLLRPDTKVKCPFCKEKIPSNAMRCSHCTADLSGQEAQADIEKQLKRKERNSWIAIGFLSIFPAFLVFGVLATIFSSFVGNNSTTNISTSPTSQPMASRTPEPTETRQEITPTPTPTPPQPINYATFQKVNFEDYVKNPPAYYGKQIRLIGLVSDFLAAGDRGGDINLIQILNAQNFLTGSKIMLAIWDSDNYQIAASSLNKTADVVLVYGTGWPSLSFTTGMGGSSLRPTISVLRLDKCNSYSENLCSGGTTRTLFSQKNW